MSHKFTFTSFLCLCLMAMMFMIAAPENASAQTLPGGGIGPVQPDVCTNFVTRAQNTFGNTTSATNTGLLSGIYTFINNTVNSATKDLFQSFTNNPKYQKAVYAAITLMITFYGVGFIIGIVQPSFQQVLVRLVKVGIIFSLISSTGWTFFSNSVVKFFQNGSDDIIKGVQHIATGIAPTATDTPFYALDRVADFVVQPDTIIAIMGAIGAGGPFGLTMGGLMLIAMAGFVRLLLKTLQTYAITFVARALILGLAPIFFIFLLFDRTKSMFISWLNALINLSLQPILLFTFMSFFIVMIENSAKEMLGTELCWQQFSNVEGSSSPLAFWRFRSDTGNSTGMGDMTYQGALECLLSPDPTVVEKCKKKPFPISIVDLLSFLILVFLATRFTEVVQRISSELSNALVALDGSGKLDQLLSSQNKAPGGGIGPLNIKGGGTGKKGK